MYNLSPRFKKTSSNTPAHVSANTYILCIPCTPKKNLAPFLSTNIRKTSIAKRPYTEAIYDPQTSRHIKGGSALRSKAIRFKESVSDTPGPADYDPKPAKCKHDPPPCHGTGRKYVCRVPYSLIGRGPSIPTHMDENGYDVTINGDVVKIPADEHDKTRGPAFYDVPTGDFCWTTKKYRGCCWSKSKTKRTTIKPSGNPPPGAYDIKFIDCPRNEKDERYREMARLLTFLPRFIDGVQLNTLKEDLPGPAYYDINTSSIRCKNSLSINPTPMIAGAKRFDTIESDTPGPGHYEPDECYGRQKQFSTKATPFGFEAFRFKTKKGPETPGPPHYHLKTSLEEKLMKRRLSYSEAPFNQTAQRKIGFISNEAYLLPGPSDYDVDRPEVETACITSSCFKAQAKRFPAARKSEDADPATYNVDESFNKNRNRTSHNTGKVPFQSRQRRSRHVNNAENPGPADYLSQGNVGDRGLYFDVAPRFKYVIDDLPGPGAYTVHPSTNLSMYRAMHSHNLRLKENVLRCKFRLSPYNTWKCWSAEIKKNKKLIWFEKPPADYRHCITAI